MQNQSPNQYSSCTAVKLWIHNMNEKLTQTCSGVWVWHISPSTWCHMTESCFRELLKSFRVISVRSRSERCVNARKAGAASISPERSARTKGRLSKDISQNYRKRCAQTNLTNQRLAADWDAECVMWTHRNCISHGEGLSSTQKSNTFPSRLLHVAGVHTNSSP